MKPFSLLFILFFYLSLHGSEKTSILILHSYSQEYSWTKKQHSSFVNKLKESNKEFDFFTEYLDTKRLELTQEYQNNFLDYLKMKYSKSMPDLVYVTDDNALEFIYSNYKKLFKNDKKIPVFFSGINNLDMQNTLPKDIYRGVYEIKEIKPNIELIKQFSPQTRDIYFIGDNSNTYKSIKKIILSTHKEYPNFNFKFISDINISNILNNLPEKPRSFVVLTTIGGLKDSTNNTLLPKESIDILKDNNNLIILTMEDAYMYDGVVGGYVTSGLIQGEKTAELVLKYLDMKTLKGIDSLKKSSTYYFNSKEIVDSRIILSEYIARNATIIDKNNEKSQQNKKLLLDIFFIIWIMLFFAMAVVYAIQKKKYKNQSEKLAQLEQVKNKLNHKDEFINYILSFNDIGYWRLDLKDNKLFVSLELLNILELDSSMCQCNMDEFSYYVHHNDKKLFNDNLDFVKSSKKSSVFQHKFVTSNQAIIKVTHIIYTEYVDHSPASIMGIIKVEK